MAVAAQAADAQHGRQKTVTAIDTDLTEVIEKIDRYLNTFENNRGAARLPGMVKTTGMGSGMGSAFGPCPTCDGTGYVSDNDADD